MGYVIGIVGSLILSIIVTTLYCWYDFSKEQFMDRADFKYNGGAGALLCSKCRVIIKIGKDYTDKEKLASRGKITLPPQYCNNCKQTSYEDIKTDNSMG